MLNLGELLFQNDPLAIIKDEYGKTWRGRDLGNNIIDRGRQEILDAEISIGEQGNISFWKSGKCGGKNEGWKMRKDILNDTGFNIKWTKT